MEYQTLSDQEAYEIAIEAYIYFYPLITMDVTRRVTTNLESGKKSGYGPMNVFHHVRTYPDADFRVVVRPNFDTLYSLAWLDLTKGPVIISTPDTGGRYYLLPLLDMWTDVLAAPGKRTSGTQAGRWVVIPPGWRGKLPQVSGCIQSSTRYVWVVGRTKTDGPKDYGAVHRVQDGFSIVPLSRLGKGPRSVTFKPDPTVDMQTPPLAQVNTMPVDEYFTYGAALLALHPPHLTDWSIIARLGRIGIEPGMRFALTAAQPSVQKVLARAAADALTIMQAKAPTVGRFVNGWQLNTETMGVYGNDYLKRAIIAAIGLGANQPEDAIYPLSQVDADGNPLDGANNYALHFAQDELPPVGAFWSLTLYDQAGFAIENPLGRFAIGSRDDLNYNSDGSLDIYLQHGAPADKYQANWLPAPAGRFNLTLRLYAPKPKVRDGRWVPPAIRRA